jgi:hypothetical protein
MAGWVQLSKELPAVPKTVFFLAADLIQEHAQGLHVCGIVPHWRCPQSTVALKMRCDGYRDA